MIVIAIDGPAGAGKSTIAKALAKKLSLRYLDTGAMYRAVTFAALTRNLDLSNESAIAKVASECVMLIDDDSIIIDGLDATQEIRGQKVTRAVSIVATNSLVRTELRGRQQQWVSEHGGGVVEGRDIGSVVFPDATLKVYLTASPLVRAKRRVAQSGGDVELIAAEIAERDQRDSSRSDSPLMKTSDSVMVDTSNIDVNEVVEHIERLVVARQQNKRASS
ncbi:MAG: (d)CMP kinase [Ilumatobacteraceae bacterium]|jgi:CMP/dCMP kinase|nr:MAG: cytidylate kinase [Acidimicrobium sp. BACL27 MAG-120823-bin4]MDA3042002.1 (d)CMP kinase [Actinomycetota bacterium]MDP4694760.1 (d)CMP kinase [Ilumatobacteraceae bacterium]HBZ62678.1 (d)CMP kinase [Acidimicrobium sp.]MDP4735688.1 (d)CMP kinase [Ilumatobacteraceae bacterium]